MRWLFVRMMIVFCFSKLLFQDLNAESQIESLKKVWFEYAAENFNLCKEYGKKVVSNVENFKKFQDVGLSEFNKNSNFMPEKAFKFIVCNSNSPKGLIPFPNPNGGKMIGFVDNYNHYGGVSDIREPSYFLKLLGWKLDFEFSTHIPTPKSKYFLPEKNQTVGARVQNRFVDGLFSCDALTEQAKIVKFLRDFAKTEASISTLFGPWASLVVNQYEKFDNSSANSASNTDDPDLLRIITFAQINDACNAVKLFYLTGNVATEADPFF